MAPRKHAGRLFGFVMNTDVRLNVDFEKTPQIPKIKLRVERSDNVFVLKVKIECALRLLQFRDEGARGDGRRHLPRVSWRADARHDGSREGSLKVARAHGAGAGAALH